MLVLSNTQLNKLKKDKNASKLRTQINVHKIEWFRMLKQYQKREYGTLCNEKGSCLTMKYRVI